MVGRTTPTTIQGTALTDQPVAHGEPKSHRQTAHSLIANMKHGGASKPSNGQPRPCTMSTRPPSLLTNTTRTHLQADASTSYLCLVADTTHAYSSWQKPQSRIPFDNTSLRLINAKCIRPTRLSGHIPNAHIGLPVPNGGAYEPMHTIPSDDTLPQNMSAGSAHPGCPSCPSDCAQQVAVHPHMPLLHEHFVCCACGLSDRRD